MPLSAKSNIGALYQCVPNFSEGRRPEVVAALVDSVSSMSADIRVIDYSMDPDHNRSVITLLGSANAIVNAMDKLAFTAVERIDLRTHTGIHPRIGAIDVVPVVPVYNATRSEAEAAALQIGENLASCHQIPVFFYEWSTREGRRSALPELRKTARYAIRAGENLPELTGDMAPDFGPRHPHPSAGISVVGARAPLAAYNIDLKSESKHVADKIAMQIRAERDRVPELTGVRALGLYLPRRGCGQVSMNLTRPDRSNLPAVFNYVRSVASTFGVEIAQSEIIGVIPKAIMAGADPEEIQWNDYSEKQILDYWLPE